MTFPTLADAIDWTVERWDQQRPAPLRLHQAHTTDGALGAPRFTHRFEVTLDESLESTTDATRTTRCFHPLLPRSKPERDCPECYGVGVKDVRVDRYKYAMTLALSRLAITLRPRRQPHPYKLICALADHGWDPHRTAQSLDMHYDLAEALLLRALRQLHSRYEEGPVRVKWTEKSQAQQQAEGWTAA